MDGDQVKMVMEYSGVSEELAIAALKETGNNVTEALIKLIPAPKTACAPKQKVMTEEQLFFKNTRKLLDNLDKSIRDGFISQGQPASSESSDSQVLHVEMAPQRSCYSEYHPPSPELEAQTLETVCPSQSGCSCDLQSNDQK